MVTKLLLAAGSEAFEKTCSWEGSVDRGTAVLSIAVESNRSYLGVNGVLQTNNASNGTRRCSLEFPDMFVEAFGMAERDRSKLQKQARPSELRGGIAFASFVTPLATFWSNAHTESNLQILV